MFFDTFNHKIFNTFEKFFVIIIIGVQRLSIFIFSRNRQWKGRIDIKLTVKFFNATKFLNHIIHKNGGNFVSSRRSHFDAAIFFQVFGIGKRNSCNTRSVTTWIDADNEFSFSVIVVKLFIKLLHHHQSFRIFQKRVHHRKIFR